MRTLTEFPYSHVLVLGLAKSGTAAANLLLSSNIKVRINDYRAKENDEIVTSFLAKGADVIVGSHPLEVLDGIELIVKNPGIPYTNAILIEAHKRNIPIITEIELAGCIIDNPIIGITGSNGKTTTTTLTAKMLSASNQHVQIAGNIGTVATEIAQTIKQDETMVLELSSFQLLGIQTFRPKIAMLLNIFDAHLDYHGTLENYRQAKFNIFSNQTHKDYLVYNADDLIVAEAVKHAKPILIPFSATKKQLTGVWADQKHIYFKMEKIMNREDIVLVGDHNLENILAAIAAAKLSGASNEGIYKVLTTFSGVKHRLQFVKKVNNRLYYNDSKATNMLATQKALASFEQPTILLAGGLDRGNEFTDLIPYLTHVKSVIVFGQTADKLKEMAKKACIDQVVIVKNIEEAVETATQLSEENDVILLSPACASWDQYRTFEERGDMFINAVHKLA